jgi:hypothetical protein
MGNDSVSGWTYSVNSSAPCDEIGVRLHIAVYSYKYWGPWVTWRYTDSSPRKVNAFPPSGPYTSYFESQHSARSDDGRSTGTILPR